MAITSLAGNNADHVVVRRALLSVSDKAGLVEFGRFLCDQHQVELLSTGGTAQALRDAGLPVIDVASFTGFPEILNGRVKTLHPRIHGGLLSIRGNAEHDAAMVEHSIAPIDLVCVNLYPFEETVSSSADFATCIENVDIGGPSMMRSGAKNHAAVAVVSSANQYADVMADMQACRGATSMHLRRALASAAFAQTARYDQAIAAWFAAQV